MLPEVRDPRWKDIVTGEKKIEPEFVATKILLMRLVLEVKKNPVPAVIAKSSQELHDLLKANLQVPKVQNDIKKIFG